MFKSINVVLETTEDLEIPQDTNPPWIVENPEWRKQIIDNLDHLVKKVINPDTENRHSNKLLVSSTFFFDELNKSHHAEEFDHDFFKIAISRFLDSKFPENVDMAESNLSMALFDYEMTSLVCPAYYAFRDALMKKDKELQKRTLRIRRTPIKKTLEQTSEEILRNTDVIILATTFILRDFNIFMEDWKKNIQASPNNIMRIGENRDSNKRAQEINFYLTRFRRDENFVDPNSLNKKDDPKRKIANPSKPKFWADHLIEPKYDEHLSMLTRCPEFEKIFESATLVNVDSCDRIRQSQRCEGWEFRYEHRRLTS